LYQPLKTRVGAIVLVNFFYRGKADPMEETKKREGRKRGKNVPETATANRNRT